MVWIVLFLFGTRLQNTYRRGVLGYKSEIYGYAERNMDFIAIFYGSNMGLSCSRLFNTHLECSRIQRISEL